MSKSYYSLSTMAFAVYAAIFAAGEARADQLIYVSLTQPCRLVDTRASTGGPGPLTSGVDGYLFGTQASDIASTAQNGAPLGCNIPNDAEAISVNMNLLNATASGNISTWSADSSAAPNIGTAVYNPTVGSPASGQVEYNTGYSTIRLGAPSGTNPGKFYLRVANGSVDMTINVVGYWLPISRGETRSNGGVALGQNTTATGSSSMAMGANTSARGITSIAMGYNADTGRHAGAFIYGDSTSHDLISNDLDDQFKVLATGGVMFLTGSNPFTGDYYGAQLAPGSTSWTTVSDRNAKTAVQPVDSRDVLNKIVAMPMNTWQYKTQESKYRHMGPMAQDFYAAFKLGESDKGIDTVDADGVALAAIQGLHAELIEKNHEMAAKLQDKDAQITALRTENNREVAALRAELAAQKIESAEQKKKVVALESLAGEMAEMKAQLAVFRKSSPRAVAVALQP